MCFIESLPVLASVFYDRTSNAVHVSDAFLGEALADCLLGTVLLLVLDLADETVLLQLAEAVADQFAGRVSVMRALSAIALSAAVVHAEGSGADLAAHVQLVSEGGGTDEEPVNIVGCEVLGARGLHVAGPLANSQRCDPSYLRDLDLGALLQVLGERLDELGGGNVFHSDSFVLVDGRELDLRQGQLTRPADAPYLHVA